MAVRIVGANLRDLSYVAANIRPDDAAEIAAQGLSPEQVAEGSMASRHSYTVEVDGNPEAAFGAGEIRRGYWICWSWGTPRIGRAIPRMTRFCLDVIMPDFLASGGQRAEARAMAANTSAVRWLRMLKAVERCRLPCFGINGEEFILFDWTRADLLNVRLQPAQSPDTGPTASGAVR